MATRMTSARFVGRTAELAELRAAFDEATASRPSLALVGGESGVGKSRLADELKRLAHESGARVLSGDCVELGDDELPYAPLLTALRPLVRDEDPSLQSLAPPLRSALDAILPGLGGGEAAGGATQSRVFEALLALLDSLSESGPVLLVIEDLHWADSSTRSFIGFLSRTVCTERLLIVGTYRSDELHRRHPLRPLLAELSSDPYTRLIDLPRFTTDELREQLEGILADPPRPELVERVYARSEGNALYAEEILAAGPDGRGTLPPTLRDALMLRVDRLSVDAQEVLRWIACQPTAAHSLVAAVAGLEPAPLRDALREAVASHIVVTVGDESYGFRHALLREVVYDDLLPGERTEMHAALARALEERIEGGEGGAHVMAQAAHHWTAAGDQPRALAAAVRAALAEVRVNAFGEAQALFERALALWERVPEPEQTAGIEQLELLRRAAFAADQAGDPARQEALLRRALELVGEDVDPGACALLRERLSQALWALHRQDEAVEELRLGLALLADGEDSRERATLLSELGKKRMLQARFDEAEQYSEEAIAVARATGDRAAEAKALNALGTALGGRGDAEEGVRLLRESLAIAHDLGLPMEEGGAWINIADVLHLAGRTEEALQVVRDGIDAGFPESGRTIDWMWLGGERVQLPPGRLGRGGGRDPAAEPPPHGWDVPALAAVPRAARARPRRPGARRGRAVGAGPRAHEHDRAAVRRAPRRHAQRAGAPGRRRPARAGGGGRRARPHRVLLRRHGPDHPRGRRRAARGGRRGTAGPRHPRRRCRVARHASALTRCSSAPASPPRRAGRSRRPSWRSRRRSTGRATGANGAEQWQAAATLWSALGRPYPVAYARWREAEALMEARDRDGAVRAASAALDGARRLGSAWLAEEVSLTGGASAPSAGRQDHRRRRAAGRGARESVRPHGPRARRARAGGRRSHQPRDRRAPPHGREDGERARLPHPREAERALAHRGGRGCAQAGPGTNRLMRALVTGATGFIGGRLASALAARARGALPRA